MLGLDGWRVACLRFDRDDHGLRDWPYLGLPFESGGDGRFAGSRRFKAAMLYRTSSHNSLVRIGCGILFVIASGRRIFRLAKVSRRTASVHDRPAVTTWFRLWLPKRFLHSLF